MNKASPASVLVECLVYRVASKKQNTKPITVQGDRSRDGGVQGAVGV